MRRLAAAVLVLGLLAGTALGAGAELLEHRAVRHPGVADDGLITLLVIGSDAGPPYRKGKVTDGRGDTLQLVAVDPQERKATIVSIPRDTLAGGDKINAQLANGGPKAQVRIVESLAGLPIDYWALTSFHGFEEMVDAIGGVKIKIERPMVDRDAKSNFPTPGPVHVDGAAALSYTRDRKSLPNGDFGRTRHGGRFLRFVHDDLRDRGLGLRELTAVTTAFAANTESNIPTSELLPLALLAMKIDPLDVRHDSLKGGFGRTRSGASVVNLRPGDAFERIRRGEVGP